MNDLYDDIELNLTMADDFVFGTVMRNERFCRKFLEMVLPEIDVGRIVFADTQKTLQEGFDVRGVRFDVYSKSDNGKVYDIEIQTANIGDLAKRTRAYHIETGIDIMNKQTKASGTYEDLPEVFVIFICTFQPFRGHKRHKYTFCNYCREDKSLALNDGAYTIFLSTKGKLDDISPELKAYLDFIEGKASNDPFVAELKQEVAKINKNSEWRRSYMHGRTWLQAKQLEWQYFARQEALKEIQEGRQEGLQEGRQRGRSEEKIDTAKRLRSMGMTDEQIQFATQLSLEEIKTL